MRIQLTLAIGILCLTLGSPGSTLAAPNPDLESLSRSSVVKFTGTEHISQPFAFDLEVAATNPALNFDNIVGYPIQIAVISGRIVAGMVEQIEQLGAAGRQGHYRVRIVPGLHRLAYRITSRSFEEMTVVQIVTGLLNEAGISRFETRLGNQTQAKELTIQYQESELAFVSRHLEEEGIHYHFEQSPSGEKLILGDSNTAFPVLAPGKLVFGSTKGPSITAFSRGQALHSGKVQAGDFNWRIPQANLTASVQAPQFADLREDVFPAPVLTPQASQQYAGLRLGARVAEGQTCQGESTYTQLQAGYRFVLAKHPRSDFNQEYVITGVEHHGTPKGYHNTFMCLPANIIFRPSPRTPQPNIAGVLPGIVVGPQGETKYVDEFGRVRVRLPWRNPAFSDSSEFGDTGWVRVAQIATGVGTTSMWIPDIGDEVVLAFEHGDPNRPVVIGSLWNGKDLPPSSLPANKFQALFQSRSLSGTINEILFDATSGQEGLILRSGNQFIQLSPKGITASSTITTPSATRQRLQPPTGLKSPTPSLVPRR